MKIQTFQDFSISDNIKKSIDEMNFKNPTPVQKTAIPEALAGKDIIVQSQTGTGKTLAYGIPVVEKLFIEDKSPQAIIICPTRELAVQISNEISKIASNTKKVIVLPVYGGESIGKQTRVLKKGAHVVVGTPGRIIDHVNRGNLDLNGIETVVLDEADEMLDMGFKPDIEEILNQTPRQKQTLLFSATVPGEVRKIAERYQKKPEFLRISKKQKANRNIVQYYFNVNGNDKLQLLGYLIDRDDFGSVIVFCNSKKRASFVNSCLQNNGFSSDVIHSDINQKRRDKIMNKFRNGNIRILVATDLAARGLDISNLDCVVNYDVARTPDEHVHRIGRTGRVNRKGLAFTFVDGMDEPYFRKIQKSSNFKIKKQRI